MKTKPRNAVILSYDKSRGNVFAQKTPRRRLGVRFFSAIVKKCVCGLPHTRFFVFSVISTAKTAKNAHGLRQNYGTGLYILVRERVKHGILYGGEEVERKNSGGYDTKCTV